MLPDLRGVSGEAFGRTYPIHGVTTVGRASECDLRLDEPGMSCMHARLLPTDDGVLVEDIGSTNGCFVNGKRVLRGDVRVGDELGFDTLRFRLVAPGQTEHHEEVAAPSASSNRTWMIVGGVAVAAAVLLVLAFL